MTFIEQLDEGAGCTLHKTIRVPMTVAVKVIHVGRKYEMVASEVEKTEFLRNLTLPTCHFIGWS